jgi:hypothetical protein
MHGTVVVAAESTALAVSAKSAAFRMAALTASAGTAPARVSNCVECLQANGVWCSRTFSYQTNTALLQTNSSTTLSVIANNLYAAANTQLDNGACCGTIATLNGFASKVNAAATTLTAAGNLAANKQYNNWACAAFSNNAGTANSGTATKFKLAVGMAT